MKKNVDLCCAARREKAGRDGKIISYLDFAKATS